MNINDFEVQENITSISGGGDGGIQSFALLISIPRDLSVSLHINVSCNLFVFCF